MFGISREVFEVRGVAEAARISARERKTEEAETFPCTIITDRHHDHFLPTLEPQFPHIL